MTAKPLGLVGDPYIALARQWQDDAAGAWGSKEHNALQRCSDELTALRSELSSAGGGDAVAEVIDALEMGVLIPSWIGGGPAPDLPIGTKLYTAAAIGQPVGGWREIESAPKDGTRILGITSSGYAVLVQWTGDEWMSNVRSGWPITHWQPLPPPPDAAAGAKS